MVTVGEGFKFVFIPGNFLANVINILDMYKVSIQYRNQLATALLVSLPTFKLHLVHI